MRRNSAHRRVSAAGKNERARRVVVRGATAFRPWAGGGKDREDEDEGGEAAW